MIMKIFYFKILLINKIVYKIEYNYCMILYNLSQTYAIFEQN